MNAEDALILVGEPKAGSSKRSDMVVPSVIHRGAVGRNPLTKAIFLTKRVLLPPADLGMFMDSASQAPIQPIRPQHNTGHYCLCPPHPRD